MADVQLTANLQPAPACYPPDINTLLELIAGGGITASIQDSLLGGSYRGSTAPASPITNPIWFVVDGAGRPQGIKMFYNGNWRPVPTSEYGDIKLYGGYTYDFDGTGRGSIGTWHDGWAICNGLNGTPDLRGRFVAGAQWGSANDGSGYTGWVTDADGRYYRYAGGAKIRVLTAAMLPSLQAQVWVTIQHTTLGGPGPFYSPANVNTDAAHQGPAERDFNWPVTAGDNQWGAGGTDVSGIVNARTQEDLSLPAFYALAYIMYVGYQ